jgi:hypothetical protein
MRSNLLFLAMLLASPAAAQEQKHADDTAIVVTGTPLSETEKRLRDCLERQCSPREDIAASLAHAENQFVAGEYRAARRTLAASHGRNARHAATLPVEVADLDRAYGRLSNVSGFPDFGRILQIDSLDALKAGLDSSDSRILIQRLMVGDEFAGTGRLRAAEDIYERVAREAKKKGKLRVMGFAMLRHAVLLGAVASVDPIYRPRAEGRLRRLLDTTDPQLADFRTAGALLRASLTTYDKGPRAIDAAIADLGSHRFTQAVLVYAPPLQLAESGEDKSAVAADKPQWIDLRFRIAPDGRVHDVETLRESEELGGGWPALVRKAVAERRYAPMTIESADGLVKIERFSFVRDFGGAKFTRMRGLSAKGRITSLDLTPAASASGTN